MSVCTFYLNGNCRFGDKCWNRHPDLDTRYSKKGDYYVSYDKRSLSRSEPHQEFASNVPFSFNRALENKSMSPNRFAALSEIDMEEMTAADHETHLFSTPRVKSQFSFKLDNRKEAHQFSNPAVQSSGQFSLSHLSGQVPNNYEGLFRPQGTSQPTKLFSTTNQSSFGSSTNTLQSFNDQRMDDAPLLSTNNQTPFGIPNKGLFGRPQNLIDSGINVRQSLFGKPQFDNKDKFKSDEENERTKNVLSDSIWLEKISCQVYSKMEELTDLEKNYFTATTFKHDEIPVRPPPKEMCS